MRILPMLFILTLILSCILSAEAAKKNPEINLSADLKAISGNSYSIDYHIEISGIEPSAFMDQKISYPYYASTIEGMIFERTIKEKDFLYSERNIDLNGDGDTDDSFPVEYKSDYIIIKGVRANPLFIKTKSNYIMSPYDSSGRENSTRITPEGDLFAIHTYEPLVGKIKIMLADSTQGKIFREFPNSLVIIEIIQNHPDETDSFTINNLKPDTNFTNERVFSPGGENLKRHFTGINAVLQNNSSSGSFRIDNITGNFTVAV